MRKHFKGYNLCHTQINIGLYIKLIQNHISKYTKTTQKIQLNHKKIKPKNTNSTTF